VFKAKSPLYLKEDGLTLRLYFSDIDKRREVIESAPGFTRMPLPAATGVAAIAATSRRTAPAAAANAARWTGKPSNSATDTLFGSKTRKLGRFPNTSSCSRRFISLRK
jgi:hypothetical protein